MANRYDARFAELKEKGVKSFVPFTVLGWPDEERSFQIVKSMIDSGVSCLELGIAFSDPVADGPIIQKASFATLESGFGVADAFKLIKRIRQLDDKIPIGLLVYYNIVLSRGIEAFFKAAADAGVDGILIADLPVECVDEVVPAARATGVVPILIVSPMTTPARLDTIVASAGGFLYLVSRLGVTGTGDRNQDSDARLKSLVGEVKKRTQLPLLAGFGVSSPAQAQVMLSLGADGVITGSRVIELADAAKDTDIASALKPYFLEMMEACNTRFVRT